MLVVMCFRVTLVTDLQVKAFRYMWILKVSVCSLTVLANEESWSYCFNQRSKVAPFWLSKYVIGTISNNITNSCSRSLSKPNM
jgi:hypothetical protein